MEKLFRYSAVIGLGLERSGVRWEVSPATARDAVERQPTWPTEWPDRSTLPQVDSLVLALRKVAALLDFDARIEGNTGDEIRQSILTSFPALTETKVVPRGRSYRGEAYILADGIPRWQYESSEDHKVLPGLSTAKVNGKSDLDTYIQNVMRADLYDRIAAAER
jgi:hypothetical protein